MWSTDKVLATLCVDGFWVHLYKEKKNYIQQVLEHKVMAQQYFCVF